MDARARGCASKAYAPPVVASFLAFFLFFLTLDALPAPAEPPSPLQVRFIRFKGVSHMVPGELKKVMETREKGLKWWKGRPFRLEVFKKDLQRIEKYYRSQGFYHAKVLGYHLQTLLGREVIVTIRIFEGPPMKVTRLDLVVDGTKTGPWHRELRHVLPLHVSSRFVTSRYEKIQKVIERYFAEWGYPKVWVDMRARLDKRTNEASVWIDVKRGPVCFFGPVLWEGLHRIHKEVVERQLAFREGQRFQASKLEETRKRLMNLRLFQFVDVKILKLQSSSTILPIKMVLKESKPMSVRVGVGYGTQDQFRGQLALSLRGLWGGTRRMELHAKASSLIQTAEGTYWQPGLWNRRNLLKATAGFSQEIHESFTNARTYINLTSIFRRSSRFNLQAGYRLETNRLLKVTPGAEQENRLDREGEEYFVSSIYGGCTYRRVDDELNPQKGLQFSNNVEWATEWLGSQVSFIKLSLEGRGYLPLRGFGVLATRLKWGGIRELAGTVSVPIFERFFSGGSDSVRGYPYQKLGPLDDSGEPLGGLTLLESNLDWRIPIRKSWQGVLFFDFGNVSTQGFRLFWDRIQTTAGVGVRYETPIGPLRLDVGYQLNPPGGHFFKRYEIHFSVGQAF